MIIALLNVNENFLNIIIPKGLLIIHLDHFWKH